MGFLDSLANIGNNIKNSGLAEKLASMKTEGKPLLETFQYDNDGNIDYGSTLNMRQNTTPMTLGEKLFGRNMTIDKQIFDPKTNEAEITTLSSYKPGFFNDLNAGMNENYNNAFDVNNLAPRGRGLAYKVGEGLGSVARGLSGALGDAYIAGAEGLGAGLKRQNIRMADKVYRDDLIRNNQNSLINSEKYKNANPEEQQAMLNEIADRVNNIKGFMGDDIYKNLISTQQMRDNADWRKFYFDAQQRNQEIDREFRQRQLENSIAQANANRNLQWAELGERRRANDMSNALNMAKLQAIGTNSGMDKATQKSVNENMQTLSDINAGLNLIEENPNAYSWIKGKLGADITNRIDPKGIKARTTIDNITAVYRKWLTGAQMSDAERKAYERFLPAPTDNYQTVKAKLEGMRDSIQRKNDAMMNGYNAGTSVNADPLGIL